MGNYSWYMREKDEWIWPLSVLLLIAVFLIWNEVIESGHLLFYIVCLILWIALYYIFWIAKKKIISRPASLWRAYKYKYPIVVQYAPPKWINPAEAWLLYNCSVEPTDLTSLIYQWKFERLIDIKIFKWKNSGKEFVKLFKKDDIPFDRPLYETEIFNSIFRMGDIKIIQWAFQLRYALMLEDLEYYWIKKWWVKVREQRFWKVKKLKSSLDSYWDLGSYICLYLFLFLFYLVLEILGIFHESISLDFSDFIYSVIVFFWIVLWLVLLCWAFNWWWGLKYTEKWAELASQVIWYSKFIKSCDQEKIKFFLKEDPLFIDRTLPYATAFGMETEFLGKISPLRKDWNAKYVKWQKASPLLSAINILFRSDSGWLL